MLAMSLLSRTLWPVQWIGRRGETLAEERKNIYMYIFIYTYYMILYYIKLYYIILYYKFYIIILYYIISYYIIKKCYYFLLSHII